MGYNWKEIRIDNNTPICIAPVILTYLSDDKLLHFHTYTWDWHCERWKLYIFVVDETNKVSVWER